MDRHRLIFNKFSISEEHVLLITKDFEPQKNPLNKSDWLSAILTCKALDAMLYFNCGFLSGASIPHKHMQLIPYSSLHMSLLPVEQAALSFDHKGEQLFHLPHFQSMKHVFCDLNMSGFDFFNKD